MHCNNTNIFIGTHESVYRDSPIGNLKTSLVRIMLSLQQGFEGNSQTRLSVGVDYLPTVFATEQGIVGGMSFPNSTAVGAPFTCVPTINYVQRNAIVKTTLLKDGFELCKGNAHDGSVEPFSFRFEFGKVFNGDFGIKTDCKFDNLPYHLPQIGLYKIAFCGLELGKFSFGFEGLQCCPANHELFSPGPDMLSKIGLIENLARWSHNGDCKVLGVDVNSKDILSWQIFTFLGKISNDLTVWQQPIGFTNPPVGNQGGIPLEVSVLFDWNRNSLTRNNSKLNKEVGFCREGFAVAGNVEFDTDCFDGLGVFTPSIPYKRADNLNIERGGFLAG